MLDNYNDHQATDINIHIYMYLCTRVRGVVIYFRTESVFVTERDGK